jgi:hypothetical protein
MARLSPPGRRHSFGAHGLRLAAPDREAAAPVRAATVDAWNFAGISVSPREEMAPSAWPGAVQPKLVIGSVDDPLEREADRIADQVIRMPDSDLAVSAAGPKISRKCASCEEDDSTLRSKPAGMPLTDSQIDASAAVQQAIRLPGQPIDRKTLDFFEPRMGWDFSSVRIHLGTAAEASAQTVGARAYTVGTQIVFGAGAYAPGSDIGRRLLAHELTHVVQQGAHPPGRRTARTAASQPTQPVAITGSSPPTLARQPAASPAHCSAAARSCATGMACEQPDVAGNGTASSSWQLDLNIDTDVASSTDIYTGADVGHTYVAFSESNGARYSYGFYPVLGATFDPIHTTSYGCMVHPDNVHESCVDYTKSYELSLSQYSTALQYAQLLCKATPRYDLQNWNCTTAAVEIAKRAGQTPPAAKGPVAGGSSRADNPNTLKEGYLDQDVPTRHLASDSDIRDWVSTHNTADIAALSTSEKIRLLNRLLDGWISDEDVAAFEKICSSVDTLAEQLALRTALGPRENDIRSPAQRNRIHMALFIVIETPAQIPGTAQG